MANFSINISDEVDKLLDVLVILSPQRLPSNKDTDCVPCVPKNPRGTRAEIFSVLPEYIQVTVPELLG